MTLISALLVAYANCTLLLSTGVMMTGTVDNINVLINFTYPSVLGYVGFGIGSSMLNADIIIVWANSDGTVTASRRTGVQEAMPLPFAVQDITVAT